MNLRLIVLRVYAHMRRNRNKLDVAERGKEGPGGEGPAERSEGEPLSPWFRGVFLPLVVIQLSTILPPPPRQRKSAFSVYFR